MRYRIINKDGTSFLARKGSSLKELKSWKSAYNRWNKDKVSRIIAVAERKKPTKKRVTGSGFPRLNFRF